MWSSHDLDLTQVNLTQWPHFETVTARASVVVRQRNIDIIYIFNRESDEIHKNSHREQWVSKNCDLIDTYIWNLTLHFEGELNFQCYNWTLLNTKVQNSNLCFTKISKNWLGIPQCSDFIAFYNMCWKITEYDTDLFGYEMAAILKCR